MRDTPDRPAASLRVAEAMALGLPMAWLATSAACVSVDYYDGFDSIANALYFLGETDHYITTRAPLMGGLLAPAVALQGLLGLHPLDLRTVHATVALMNSIYLLGIYALLAGHFGRRLETLVAFVAALPCFLFFSYGSFVSHDLLAGGAMLWMLAAAARFLERPAVGVGLLLVAVGAAAALLKHTWAICWIATLVAAAVELVRTRGGLERPTSAVLGLALAAVASAVVAWVAIAVVLADALPGQSFWLRPVSQIRFLLGPAAVDIDVPLWIYLRNAPAFGPLAVAFLVPGLIAAWRSEQLFERMVAVAALVLLAALHMLGLREVRYAFVLVPILAFLAVRPAAWVLQRRWGAAALAGALLVTALPIHPYSLASEAGRIADPFYHKSEVRRFLAPLEEGPERRAPIYSHGGMISTTPPLISPLAADYYHRIFHFGFHHIQIFYRYARDEMVLLPEGGIRRLAEWPDGSAILRFTEGFLVNPMGWTPGEPERKHSLSQVLFLADALPLRRHAGTSFETPAGLAIDVALDADRAHLEGPGVAALAGAQQIRLRAGEQTVARARRVTGDAVALELDSPGHMGVPDLPLEIRFFREASRIRYRRRAD